MPKIKTKTRCPWGNSKNKLMVKYHDKEWGKPVYKDNKHFEMLILEGAQAGLSWDTILQKRENYQIAFAQFNPAKVAKFTKAQIEKCLKNPGLVRNRLKIESTVSNAKAFLNIKAEFGSFNAYIWQFVNNKPIINTFDSHAQIPNKTPLSDLISKDLKKRGFRFVGSTIIYAYMQAIGMVNDHLTTCFVRQKQQQQWYVYMLQTKDGKLYTGITTDISRRLLEHHQSKKGAKYLRGKAPLKLVYKKRIGTKAQALSEEYRIKKLSKKEKEALIV
ncbi:MAG: DNA-3-methyladenine glycosylase I [Proteobacteria bacterium]|nr:DNA-3-methyladenine glycosylase I [Pseudomonadota bacterium]